MNSQDYDNIIEAFFCYQGFMRRPTFDEPLKLTKLQDMAVHTLFDLGGMSMTALAERMAASKEQATRTASSLVERGLVARGHSEGNRKTVIVSLTPAGVEFARLRQAEYGRQLEESLAGLSEDERRALVEASRTATALFKKALGDDVACPLPCD